MFVQDTPALFTGPAKLSAIGALGADTCVSDLDVSSLSDLKGTRSLFQGV